MNDNTSTIIMPPYSNSSSVPSSASSSSSSGAVSNIPKAAQHVPSNNQQDNDELLQLVSQELETMKRPPKQQQQQNSPTKPSSSTIIPTEHSFPPACLRLMTSLAGNLECIDCHSRTDISWASVSFGCLMCLQCSGKHRSLGVQTSFVKSVSMDGWKAQEVLSMLEGGNEQLDNFFMRHDMGKKMSPDSSPVKSDGSRRNSLSLLDRYKTKAASFYRQHLINHAKELVEGGVYKGREASRSKKKKTSSATSSSSSQPSSSSSSRKHHLNRPLSKPTLLPITESSANNATNEDAPLPPLASSSPAVQPMVKRQRSNGSGSDVSMEICDIDLEERD